MRNLATRRGARKASTRTVRPVPMFSITVLPSYSSRVYARKIRGLLDGINSYSRAYRSARGTTPRLGDLNRALGRMSFHMRKTNVMNPQMIQSLATLRKTLGGMPTAPKALRNYFLTLARFFKESVRRDAKTFIAGFQRLLNPIHRELQFLELELKRNLKTAKGSRVSFRVDPSILRQLNAFNSQIKRFRAKWFARINRFAQHGSRDVARQVEGLKNQIQDLQRLVARNISLINKCKKFKYSKARPNTKTIITKSTITKHQNNWKKVEKEFDQFRIPVERFVEQLRAVKIA